MEYKGAVIFGTVSDCPLWLSLRPLFSFSKFKTAVPGLWQRFYAKTLYRLFNQRL